MGEWEVEGVCKKEGKGVITYTKNRRDENFVKGIMKTSKFKWRKRSDSDVDVFNMNGLMVLVEYGNWKLAFLTRFHCWWS